MERHTVRALLWTSAIAVILLWLISVMVDCRDIFSNSCDLKIWDSWLDLWRLKWIYNYNEMIAGLIAAGAAALIIVATRVEIDAADRSRREEKNIEHSALLGIARKKFFDAFDAIWHRRVTERHLHLFEDLRYSSNFIADYYELYFLMTKTSENTTDSIRKYLNDLDPETDPPAPNLNQRRNALRCRILHELLGVYKGNFFPTDQSRPELTPSDELLSMMRRHNISPAELGPISAFYNWTLAEAQISHVNDRFDQAQLDN